MLHLSITKSEFAAVVFIGVLPFLFAFVVIILMLQFALKASGAVGCSNRLGTIMTTFYFTYTYALNLFTFKASVVSISDLVLKINYYPSINFFNILLFYLKNYSFVASGVDCPTREVCEE